MEGREAEGEEEEKEEDAESDMDLAIYSASHRERAAYRQKPKSDSLEIGTPPDRFDSTPDNLFRAMEIHFPRRSSVTVNRPPSLSLFNFVASEINGQSSSANCV